MKYTVLMHEVCMISWQFQVEAEHEEEAKRKVRKHKAGDPIASTAEPLGGYPIMLEVITPN